MSDEYRIKPESSWRPFDWEKDNDLSELLGERVQFTENGTVCIVTEIAYGFVKVGGITLHWHEALRDCTFHDTGNPFGRLSEESE